MVDRKFIAASVASTALLGADPPRDNDISRSTS